MLQQCVAGEARGDSGSIDLFTTRGVPAVQRATYWRAVVAETFPGMVADVSPGIKADLARWQLGRLDVARACSNQARVSRVSERRGERTLVFHLLRRGRIMMSQKQNTHYAGLGDIMVSEETIPYSIHISDANECMIVHIPVSMLGEAVAARDWYAHLLDGRNPNVAMLARMLGGVWDERSRLSHMEGGLDEVLIGLSRLACLSSQTAVHDTGREPVAFALAHLHDPALGTALIAEATGLSLRAVQKSFARHVASTPTGFISDQRLQRAAQMLRAQSDHTVTNIAFATGFSDSAFFSRCFRRRFGVTPTQWRSMN